MLQKTSLAFLVFVLLKVVTGQEGPPAKDILMSHDRLGDDCVEGPAGTDDLTTCTVQVGSTAGFSGSLLIVGGVVDDLVVNMKWNTLGVTSINKQQMCLVNGQTVIGNEQCKTGTKRIGRQLHHDSSTRYTFKIPDKKGLATDNITLTGTVRWSDGVVDENFLINIMRVIFKTSNN